MSVSYPTGNLELAILLGTRGVFVLVFHLSSQTAWGELFCLRNRTLLPVLCEPLALVLSSKLLAVKS